VDIQADEQHAPRQQRRRGDGRPADDVHQGGQARLGARRRRGGFDFCGSTVWVSRSM
jgi:hypothetical protein